VSVMSIVVVSFNVRSLLADCLMSINSVVGVAEIVVVDNASGDGSVDMVRTTFPRVRLIVNEQNPGFGAAANQGLRACTTPYALLLNADTRLRADTLIGLARALDADDQAAVAGPRLVGADGQIQASCFPFPTPLHVFLDLAGGNPSRQLPRLGKHTPHREAQDQPCSVDWTLGAALALRREAIDAVGGFDEGYLMYCEETDLCYRLRAAGWRTIFVPATTVEHIGGASTAQQRRRWDIQLFRSRFRFYEQHYSRGRLIALRVVVGVGMIAKLTRDIGRRVLARDAEANAHAREDIRVWSRALGMAVQGDATREQREPTPQRR